MSDHNAVRLLPTPGHAAGNKRPGQRQFPTAEAYLTSEGSPTMPALAASFCSCPRAEYAAGVIEALPKIGALKPSPFTSGTAPPCKLYTTITSPLVVR
jgi:hypothetical protein